MTKGDEQNDMKEKVEQKGKRPEIVGLFTFRKIPIAQMQLEVFEKKAKSGKSVIKRRTTTRRRKVQFEESVNR